MSDNESNTISGAVCSTKDIDTSAVDAECDVPYYLIASDSEDEGNDINSSSDNSIKDQLTDWAVEFDIPMNALSRLLSILRLQINDLPKDPRTLLSRKVSYEIENICDGEYYHFGLSSGIQKILSEEPDIEVVSKHLRIQ